tara:strand:- start:5 stop:334 length:330 start_codon:yes stop_codon:yes gene_type:complete
MRKNLNFLKTLFALSTLLLFNACGPNLDNPEGTYTGSGVVAGARFDVTLVIESTTSCKIRWTTYATGWDRYSMRIDKGDNTIYFGDNKLVPSGGGFKLYSDGVYFCKLS